MRRDDHFVWELHQEKLLQLSLGLSFVLLQGDRGMISSISSSCLLPPLHRPPFLLLPFLIFENLLDVHRMSLFRCVQSMVQGPVCPRIEHGWTHLQSPKSCHNVKRIEISDRLRFPHIPATHTSWNSTRINLYFQQYYIFVLKWSV